MFRPRVFCIALGGTEGFPATFILSSNPEAKPGQILISMEEIIKSGKTEM
ncbi:MAG: hypothetical protein R3B93_15335 [Bacteroidia bacterium]